MEERTRSSHSAEKMYEKTLQRAFRLLSYRPRTIAEMRGRLLEKEWAVPEIVEQVIARLQTLNYLNDEDYAERFVTSRLERGAVGAIRLRRDLRQKHLPAPAIDQAVRQIYAEHPEEELIVAVTEKWLARKGTPATPADAQKLWSIARCDNASPPSSQASIRRRRRRWTIHWATRRRHGIPPGRWGTSTQARSPRAVAGSADLPCVGGCRIVGRSEPGSTS